MLTEFLTHLKHVIDLGEAALTEDSSRADSYRRYCVYLFIFYYEKNECAKPEDKLVLPNEFAIIRNAAAHNMHPALLQPGNVGFYPFLEDVYTSLQVFQYSGAYSSKYDRIPWINHVTEEERVREILASIKRIVRRIEAIDARRVIINQYDLIAIIYDALRIGELQYNYREQGEARLDAVEEYKNKNPLIARILHYFKTMRDQFAHPTQSDLTLFCNDMYQRIKLFVNENKLIIDSYITADLKEETEDDSEISLEIEDRNVRIPVKRQSHEFENSRSMMNIASMLTPHYRNNYTVLYADQPEFKIETAHLEQYEHLLATHRREHPDEVFTVSRDLFQQARDEIRMITRIKITFYVRVLLLNSTETASDMHVTTEQLINFLERFNKDLMPTNKDSLHFSPLYIAIRHGVDLTIIDKLIELGHEFDFLYGKRSSFMQQLFVAQIYPSRKEGFQRAVIHLLKKNPQSIYKDKMNLLESAISIDCDSEAFITALMENTELDVNALRGDEYLGYHLSETLLCSIVASSKVDSGARSAFLKNQKCNLVVWSCRMTLTYNALHAACTPDVMEYGTDAAGMITRAKVTTAIPSRHLEEMLKWRGADMAALVNVRSSQNLSPLAMLCALNKYECWRTRSTAVYVQTLQKLLALLNHPATQAVINLHDTYPIVMPTIKPVAPSLITALTLCGLNMNAEMMEILVDAAKRRGMHEVMRLHADSFKDIANPNKTAAILKEIVTIPANASELRMKVQTQSINMFYALKMLAEELELFEKQRKLHINYAKACEGNHMLLKQGFAKHIVDLSLSAEYYQAKIASLLKTPFKELAEAYFQRKIAERENASAKIR